MIFRYKKKKKGSRACLMIKACFIWVCVGIGWNDRQRRKEWHVKINIGNTKVPTSLNVINFGYRIICIKIKDKYCK